MTTFTSAGEMGEYTIAKDGYHPERGRAFHYKDQNCEFWFYVRWKPCSDGRMELSVWNASARQFAGGHPDIDASHVSIVEANIRSYFEAFNLFGEPREPTNPAGPIKFDWRLRR